ncbi:hypothetical protein L198_03892 [Cryptococcus wingfieldii CBS 7118]|uniref:Peptidase M20 domain-containing protein 2 n=1 Tax=Cryptococcus wingfieldii CBS 7118 TaxID=1295528 RepID=A0A1E3J8Z1_9TREE|nr:hypothetical protein L198_03892 [Cryptococcus wingfieldii CBS 7118]ODN97329.1 hypothetical protein L198_03892 [Cryptococcus wingfieldii CBS 7118]
MRVISPPTSTPGQLPVDIQALVNQTISSLKDLVPPTASIVKDTIKDAIFQAIDAIDADMRELNLAIHENPELGFKEFKAHENLVASLNKLDFDVTNPSSLSTAFVASYTHGENGRVFGFNSEFDALPNVGHGKSYVSLIACGHNLIAVVGVAAAVGLKAALKACNIAGTVKLIGTPAEEGGGGKVILLREGIYDDLDACAMAHPGGGSGPPEYEGSCTVGGPGTLARAGFEIEFFGRGAHAGAAPWMGINALDAAVQGYTAVSMLRQQLEPTMRVHGIILGSEQWAQNIIPSYSKVSYSTRALDVKSCLELRDKVVACFKAAAEATGCTMEVKAEEDEVYADLRNNEPMAYSYQAFMENVIGQKITMGGMSTASTDFGNVCYKVPAIHPGFEIPCPLGSGNHTAGFTESAGKLEAHKLAMKVAKGLAAVGAKFLVDDSFADETKKAFERFKKGKGRKCE